MTPEEREKLYDQEIAPALMAIAKKCEEADMSMTATVEYAPDMNESTMTMREAAGLNFKMALWGAQAHGNADALIMAMQKHGKEYGHNSVCLELLNSKQQ